MVSMYPYIARVVSVYHNILCLMCQFILLTWSEQTTIYLPRTRCVSQYAVSIHIVHMVRVSPYIALLLEVSPHIAHVLRVYHNMPYQFILSTWSEGLTICCMNPYCPRAQSIPQYAVSIHMLRVSPHIAHVLRVFCHILPTCSECLTICRINPCCLLARASPHIAHVLRVSPHVAHVVKYVSHYGA